MADESMVRCLEAQAEAIWPQERELLARLAPPERVLDVGAGTGEFVRRAAELWPSARFLGLDLYQPHLVRAQERAAQARAAATFAVGDAFALPVRRAAFDLVVCRHLLQAIPEPERVVAELMRVARPGGRVHVLAEDYAMMHFGPTSLDCDRFWLDGPGAFARSTGTDLFVGRRAFGLLRAAGFVDVRVDYVIVDTQRVPRATFAAIWRAWRDGYAEAIARESDLSLEHVLACFEDMLGAIECEDGYGVWHVPIVSGRRPAAGAAG